MYRRGAVAVVVLALLCGSTAVPAAGQSRSSTAVEAALRSLEHQDLRGRVWTQADLRGRITLVDFWATWCAPCRRELPFLKRARELYAGEFEILGISLDTISRRQLNAWIVQEGVAWPQIHATGGYHDPLALSFRVDRLPTNFLVDQDGRVRATDVRGRDLFIEIEKLRRRGPERGTQQ